MPDFARAYRVKRTLMLTVVRTYAVNSSASTQYNAQPAHLRFAAACGLLASSNEPQSLIFYTV